MSRLATYSGRDVVRGLGKIGYADNHPTGSHIILRHANLRRLTVPDHRELAKETLRSIIREAEISKERLIELLN